MATRELKDCVAELREKYPLIKQEFEETYTGMEMRIVCALRSTEEQAKLFAQGRTKPGHIVTWVDGVTKIGAHNPVPGQKPESRAIDVGIFVKGEYMTQSSYYRPLQTLAPKYGLKSGWSFGDPPHLETLKGAVITVKK